MVTCRLPSRLPAAETPAAPLRRLSRLPATSPLPEYEQPVTEPLQAVKQVRRLQTPADLFPEAAIPVEPSIAAERAKQEAARDRTDYAAIMQDYKDRTGNSRRKAIRSMCVWCCVGNVAEVKRCAAVQCPLHGFRMGATPEKQRPIDQNSELANRLGFALNPEADQVDTDADGEDDDEGENEE